MALPAHHLEYIFCRIIFHVLLLILICYMWPFAVILSQQGSHVDVAIVVKSGQSWGNFVHFLWDISETVSLSQLRPPLARVQTGFPSCTPSVRLFDVRVSAIVCDLFLERMYCLYSCFTLTAFDPDNKLSGLSFTQVNMKISFSVSEMTLHPAPRLPWRTVLSASLQSRAPWMWT